MAWLDYAGAVMFIALVACVVHLGQQHLRQGDLYRTCRMHLWDGGKPPRCSRCRWTAGQEPPSDWWMGGGP